MAKCKATQPQRRRRNDATNANVKSLSRIPYMPYDRLPTLTAGTKIKHTLSTLYGSHGTRLTSQVTNADGKELRLNTSVRLMSIKYRSANADALTYMSCLSMSTHRARSSYILYTHTTVYTLHMLFHPTRTKCVRRACQQRACTPARACLSLCKCPIRHKDTKGRSTQTPILPSHALRLHHVHPFNHLSHLSA